MPKPLRRPSDIEFFNLMATAKPFEMVIKSAMVIESEIEEIFNRAFIEPTRVHKMDLRYEQKLELALALGLDERFGPPLRNLAKVRNIFAHQIDATFSNAQANDFFSSFHKLDKKIIIDNYGHIAPGRAVPFDQVLPEEKFVLCVVTLRAAILTAQKQTSKLLEVTPDTKKT